MNMSSKQSFNKLYQMYIQFENNLLKELKIHEVNFIESLEMNKKKNLIESR